MPDAEPAGHEVPLDERFGVLRAADWWNHKVPVLLALAYWLLLGPEAVPTVGVGTAGASLAVFLVAVVGVAGLGHLLNDRFDRAQDARAGRNRVAATLSAPVAAALTAVLVGLALVPWIYLPGGSALWVLLAAEVGLLVGYSAPPLRAKERGVLGLVFDASYAFTLPALLTIATFSQVAGVAQGSVDALVAVVTVWSFATGLRGIAYHQLDDLESDRYSGARTWAVRVGPSTVARRIPWFAGIEAAAFAALVVVLGQRVPLLPIGVAVVLAWRAFQLRFLGGYDASVSVDDTAGGWRRLCFAYLNMVYERWLPLLALVPLVVRDPDFWPLLLAHVVLFDNGLKDFVRQDLRRLPSVRFTFVYWVTYQTGRLRGRWVAHQDRDLPTASDAPAGMGRWVFVVCGPDEHVRTLHVALEWLRPRTNQEIVVLTDTRRNRLPIDHDWVIDVATPEEFDDHQASIWLKVGIHHHVPLDRPACYLDSDVLAVRADVDELFERFVPPVTFALDRMIAENCVDRFSPWAMTCSCDGRYDPDSCAHLREAMADLWGVAPPADWLHWNGGVFVIDARAGDFLDEWRCRVLEAFADPRFKTRDQHALIATVWARGLEGHPTLPSEFNTILDLGSHDLTWYGGTRYAITPNEAPVVARFLHLYSNELDDPTFSLHDDVEEAVLRLMADRRTAAVPELSALLAPPDLAPLGWKAAEVAGKVRRVGGIGALTWRIRTLAWRIRLLIWKFAEVVVWPVVNLGKRIGRSLARRGRTLAGREGDGRWQALRPPGLPSRRVRASTQFGAGDSGVEQRGKRRE